jgi:predicted secreted protein
VRHFCFNKINENSPSLYRWEMNRKNKLSVSGGQISPTDMRSKQSGQPDKMAA